MTDDFNANDKIAKDLMAGKLDGYLGEREQPKAETGRRTTLSLSLSERAKAGVVPPTRAGVEPPLGMAHRTPPLSRQEWEEKNPALRTPHVLSKAKADEKLAGIRKRVMVSDAATYSLEDWDLLVTEVVGMMLDCAEGAGLVVKNRVVAQTMRRMVSRMLQEDMLFWCDDDRMIKVVAPM